MLLEDLDRVEPFRRHVTWFPTDIVEAEAAKRPRKGGGTVPAGEPDKRGGESKTPDPNADPGKTPTVRVPAP